MASGESGRYPWPMTMDFQDPEVRKLRAREAARRAFLLYEGEQVKHRSCGIALAETFSLPTAPYQILRKGGLTGKGECGAVRAGEQVLGELLGDPDPSGGVTPRLREAVLRFRQRVEVEVDRGSSPDLICEHLTSPWGAFDSPERKGFCTGMAEKVAELTASCLMEAGVAVELPPLPEK